MRVASLLTVWAFFFLAAALLYAAKWQWAPAPAAEVIKNADYGPEPTVEAIESEASKLSVEFENR